ncbi:MAG: hypothetical protein HYV26_21790, partial [Candidatus Hydrogenedentes bacterium]|nr:hypothetical protein [Candidatus Hydrogenedentota bacterium]
MRVICLVAWCAFLAARAVPEEPVLAMGEARTQALASGSVLSLPLPPLEAGVTYGLNVGLRTGALPASEVVEARLALDASTTLSKRLHAGDPSFYVPFKTGAGTATLSLERATGGAHPLETQVQFVRLAGPDEQSLFEAEPNDSAGTA